MKKIKTNTAKKAKTQKKEILVNEKELKTVEVENMLQDIVLNEIPVIEVPKPAIFESRNFSNQYQEEIYIPKPKKVAEYIEL